LKRFERAVTNDLLLNFEPTLMRDDMLWESFKDHLHNNLNVILETEEKGLFTLLFHGVRQPGESVCGFATEFKFAALNYNRVSSTVIMEDQVVHWMIKALNLTGYSMQEVRHQLLELERKRATLVDILRIIATFPEMSELTKLERQAHNLRPTGGSGGTGSFATQTEVGVKDSLPLPESTGVVDGFSGNDYDASAFLRV
jgi:hypothetical protein